MYFKLCSDSDPIMRQWHARLSRAASSYLYALCSLPILLGLDVAVNMAFVEDLPWCCNTRVGEQLSAEKVSSMTFMTPHLGGVCMMRTHHYHTNCNRCCLIPHHLRIFLYVFIILKHQECIIGCHRIECKCSCNKYE